MAKPYQKGDWDAANEAHAVALDKFRQAESALAAARHELTLAERRRNEAFVALVEDAGSMGDARTALKPPYDAATRPEGSCNCDLDDKSCYEAGHWGSHQTMDGASA